MSLIRSKMTAAAAGAVLATSLGAGGAVAVGQVNGKNIKPASISIAKLDAPLHARINNTLTRREAARLTGGNATSSTTGGTGVSGYAQVSGTAVTIESNDTGTATASCPGTARPLGGGYSTEGAVLVLTSQPSANGWTVTVVNFDSDDISITARAVCATVG